jgi:RNA polymerase sigma-70 factor (ECF subfamily)
MEASPENRGTADAAMVARARAGDRAAFGELVTRYRALAVSVATSVCRDRAMAEDAAQDAFIRAYGRLSQLTKPEAFSAWLITIVRSRAMRLAANAARRRDVYRQSAWERADGRDPSEAGPAVADALEKLDPESQQMLTLKYLRSMTCAEIAAIAGVSVPTVSRRVARALVALREVLTSEGSP